MNRRLLLLGGLGFLAAIPTAIRSALMASNYPSALDTTATLPSAGAVGANLSTFPHSALTGNVNDAVIAIQTELGTAPSGADTTVKARLDRITPTLGALTSWTPTLQQGAGVAITINYARYQRVGRKVDCQFKITATAAGSAASAIQMAGLPASVQFASFNVVGAGQFIDVSAGNLVYPFHIVVLTSTSTLQFWRVSTDTATPELGAGAGLTLASGDVISGTFWFEATAD